MSIWKNKHVLIAMAMAPVLGLLTYFAISNLVGEKPHAAVAGASYKLMAKSNCRYSSGKCGLKNVDFELELSFERLENDRLLLKLESDHPLNGVMLARVENETDEGQPVEMRSMGQDGLNWTLEIATPDPERHRLHLAASANDSLYFADVSTKFTIVELADPLQKTN